MKPNEQIAIEIFEIITEWEITTLRDQKMMCRAIADWHLIKVAKLKAEIEQKPSIKVSDKDVWLIFPDTMISIEGICVGAPGPIVKRNLRRWRDTALKEAEKLL